eukprot:1216748-Pyramimonas_sp.AAC.1
MRLPANPLQNRSRPRLPARSRNSGSSAAATLPSWLIVWHRSRPRIFAPPFPKTSRPSRTRRPADSHCP